MPFVGMGKIPPYFPPAVNRAAAFGEIKQSGIVLPGKGEPGTSDAWVAASQFEAKPATPVGTTALMVFAP
jgi:hypothetical protein